MLKKRGGAVAARSKRNRLATETLKSIEALQEEARTCVDKERLQLIEADLKSLRVKQAKLSLTAHKTSGLPSTYVKRRREELDAVARTSGRKALRVTFVSGGSPGSGKK
jgi:hypothetical protein